MRPLLKQDRHFSRDFVFILLFLNTSLVLAVYSINTVTGRYNASLTSIKQIIVLISFAYVLFKNGISLTQYNNKFVIILPLLIFLSILFTENIFDSLYKTFTFIIPYIYVLLSLNYLSKKDYNKTFSYSISALYFIYLLPVLIFFFFDRGFSATNIYGYAEETLFVSNHYGWAATITIVCSYYIFNKPSLKKSIKYIIVIISILSFYLLIISSNRSGILSILLVIILVVFKTQSQRLINYMVFALIPLFFYLSLADIEGSAINFIKEKNLSQFDTGQESRLILTRHLFNSLAEKPSLAMTGSGMFDYSSIRGVTNLGGYHNSYWDILFGAGILAFIVFLKVMIMNPIKEYRRRWGNNAIIIIPLIVIPFFESDLTGGQFLFFPWFIIMLFMNLKQRNLPDIQHETDPSIFQDRAN